MPASTEIYNALLQPPKSALEYANDYAAADTRKQQNALLNYQIQEQGALMQDRQRTRAEQEGVRGALVGLPQGADDNARVQALKSLGTPTALSQADALQKTLFERQKTQSQVAKDNAETDTKTLALQYMQRDRHLQGLASINDPQAAAAWIAQGVQLGEFKPEDAQRITQGIASGQIPLDKWKQAAQQGGMTLQQQSQQKIAELTAAESARHNRTTEGLTARGQNMTDARAQQTLQQGRIPAGYRAGANGTLEFIPGGPADPSAAKKNAPTEFQGKSAAFGSRAQEADRLITGLEGQYSPGAVNAKQALGNVWGIGGALESGANYLQPENAQKAEQAQRDFINAILRQESGAAIGAGEFDNARRQYFPQPGDSAGVISQKEANRKLAVKGLLDNARQGPAQAAPAATPAAQPGVIDFHSLK